MPFFLIPIVAGAAAYGAATQDEAGQYSAGEGERTIDAYQIWAQITSGPGASSINTGQQAASTLKGTYDERIRSIEDLSRDMDAAWQGSAGEAANSGAHPLKVWMEDSRVKLNDSDRYLGEQQDAFTTVHSKVEQVPPKPPESGFLNDIAPWETDTDRAIQEYNTKAQGNVDAFNAYFQASNDNASGMPTYSKMDGEFGKVEAGDGSGSDDGPGGPGGPGNIPGGGGAGGGYTPGQIPGGGGSGGGGYQPGNIPGGGGGGYAPGQIPGGGGRGGGYDIPGSGGYDIPGSGGYRPDVNVPAAGGYTSGGIPEWDNSTSASGYQPGSIPAADLSRGGGGGGFSPGSAGNIGGGAGGGFGPGGAGSVGGAGGFGPGGSGGFGPGSGTGSVAPGAGSGTGAGGQGGAGRGGAVGGSAGMRGMGGMGGMMGGGRGGQGGGDEEHQNKFLVEEDPNSLFGSDELTAPPVIGE